MLKGAQSMPALGGRVKTSPGGWAALQWNAAGLGGLRGRRRARALLLAAALLGTGALAGGAAGRLAADAGAHRAGACNALQMAAALGYLDDRQQRMVIRNLATAINPDVDLFPGGHRAIRQACETAAGRS